jgi:basic membrane lipoprotein Med (substrate-binding protein (PBP1-ABC) superfamily)
LNDVLLINIKKTHENILNEILAQESYIWTDNKVFIDEVNKNNGTQINMSVSKIREVATTYYKCILDVLQDTIPKKIMLFLIQSSEKMFSSVLYEKVKSQNVNQLVHEYEEIYTQRQQLEKTVKELMNSKQLIESIL